MNRFDEFDFDSDNLFNNNKDDHILEPEPDYSGFDDGMETDFEPFKNEEPPTEFDVMQSMEKPENQSDSSKKLTALISLLIVTITGIIIIAALSSHREPKQNESNLSIPEPVATPKKIAQIPNKIPKKEYPAVDDPDPTRPPSHLYKECIIPQGLAGKIEIKCCWLYVEGKNKRNGIGGVYLEKSGTILTSYLPEFKGGVILSDSFNKLTNRQYKCQFKQSAGIGHGLCVMQSFMEGFTGIGPVERAEFVNTHYVASMSENGVQIFCEDALLSSWRKHIYRDDPKCQWWPAFDGKGRLIGAYQIIDHYGKLQPYFFDITNANLD